MDNGTAQVKGVRIRKVGVNSITSAALVCGLMSVLFSASGNFYMGALLILGAMILDGIDGTMARLLKAESQFGAEFDTFVDITAFGVAPAMLVYFYLFHDFTSVAEVGYLAKMNPLGAMLGIAIVLSGAIRLARFKVVDDDHGMSGYTGMPITVNALCLSGIILLIEACKKGWGADVLPAWVNLQDGGWLSWVMYINCIICLLLQVSPFKYPKPTNTPIGQFIGVLAFLGLFIHAKTATISCCYLVPLALFYVYIAPFWYTVKQKWLARKTA